MSSLGHRDGLFWPSLFLFNSKEKDVDNILKECRNYQGVANNLAPIMTRNLIGENKYEIKLLEEACEHVALKFMLEDTDLAKELLNDDELLMKASEVYKRKQYNNKILKQLLNSFWYVLQSCLIDKSKVGDIFQISINDELKKCQEEKINTEYGKLKKLIDKVASGVKNDCYVKAVQELFVIYKYSRLENDLNEIFIKELNYEFNKAHTYEKNNTSNIRIYMPEGYDVIKRNNLMQLAMLDDKEFWQEHIDFDVVTFLNYVYELNDYKHAEKIIKHIINNLRKMSNMDIIFENTFPLYLAAYDDLLKALEIATHAWTFNRLKDFCNVSVLDNVKLCYPMSEASEDNIETGKKVWNKFIEQYTYPNNYQEVNKYLKEEVKTFCEGNTNDDRPIAMLLDIAPFRDGDRSIDRKVFTIYQSDCFSEENIWKRVYLIAYAVTLLSEKEIEQFAYLQRIFVDLTKTIEIRKNICTAHQLDNSTRDNKYNKLKSKLKELNTDINDELKKDYIIALLDRDTATIEESEQFPILEQIGDAIYGFSVAELLFYNPETERIREKFEQYINAESQVEVSKKYGFDECYIGTLLSDKYFDIDSMYFNISSNSLEKTSKNKEKYLGDSLEMIIGTIYRDKGIETSIAFTKKLLMETFKEEFSTEVHPTEKNKKDKNIERDYWTRILPSPYSDMDAYTEVLWNALHKLALVVSIGTDTKKKRQFITVSFGNTRLYGEPFNYEIGWPFYEYLTNGLSPFLDKYSSTLRTNFENK